MIVQYLIDWKDLHSRINQDCVNDAKLDSLRRELRSLRKKVIVNGVLIVDQGNGWIQELDAAIRDLAQDGESRLIPARDHLSDELKAYRQLYIEKRILIKGASRDAVIEDAVKALAQFLDESNMTAYKLPCAIISTKKYAQNGGFAWCSIDDYEESDIESQREKWEQISFSVNESADNAEFDKCMAGLSVAASAYGSIEFYDRYCGCVFFRQERIQSAPIENWDASVKRFLAPFVRNRNVGTIRFVCQIDNLVNKTCCMSKIASTITSQMCGRRLLVTFDIRAKKTGDFHNRWIHFGVGVCSLEHGMEVFKERNGSAVINKSFPLKINKDPKKKDFDGTRNLGNHDFATVQSLKNGGHFFFEDCSLEELPPSCKDDLFELKIYPPIQITL